jgi:enoyl reductase-like protein
VAARKKKAAAPRPKVTVEGMSYSMTVSVNGRPPLTLAGTTLAELDRDLKAAAAELGK